MSVKSKFKRDKKRKIKNKTKRPQVSLMSVWQRLVESNRLLEYEISKEKNGMSYDVESALLQKRKNSNLLGYYVDLAGEAGSLDGLIDKQRFVDNAAKTYMIKDIFDVLSTRNYLLGGDIEQEFNSLGDNLSSKQSVINIWAIPVTGDIKDLLALNNTSDALCQSMCIDIKDDIFHSSSDDDNHQAISLGILPVHVACSLSPQALWSIAKSLPAGIWDESGNMNEDALKELRGNIEPYTVTSNVDLSKILASDENFVGTGVLLVATRSYVERTITPSFDKQSTWENLRKAKADWREGEKRGHMLIGPPQKWSDGCLQAFLNSCDFDWGSSSRASGVDDSVLGISKIKIQEHNDVSCTLWSYLQDGRPFGVSHIPPSSKLWVLDQALDAWISQRDIDIVGFEVD